MDKIGLIAGNRKFPLLFAEAAKKRNCYIVAVAIKNDTSPKLRHLVDKIYWIGLGEFRKLFEIFAKEGVTNVVMAGQISPRRLFSKEIEKDKDLREMFLSIRDKKADTIFGKIAQKLEESGLKLLDSTTFTEDLLPQKGILTRLAPDFTGLEQAKLIAYLDIGQTVAVKSKAVVAVEALEGTDSLIRRAGKISRGGATVVKVSKPKQDMRFDIPVVGLNTIKNLIKAKARCLAIEAGKTLFIDKAQALKLADKAGISIVAV
jgi:hypothetical protein